MKGLYLKPRPLKTKHNYHIKDHRLFGDMENGHMGIAGQKKGP